MEAVNGVMDGGGPPPPSPLTGCYLLIVIGEPHSQEHKNIILQRIAKGLLSWDVTDCLIDLEKELAIITEQAPEGEEARYGERLIQYASENLVTEVLIHPAVSTLAQCVRNLLSSFTRHRHIIHAGYTFAANGSWILQDGTFSYTDFAEAFHEIEVQRVIRAYENSISVDLHCSPEGDWTRLPKESFAKNCKVRVNPVDVLTSGSPSITNFLNYISPFLVATDVEALLECSDVVGNIRFSHPTLYIFPGGQGDAALFGINGFNMLLDGGFSRKACFWDFVRHLDRLDAVLLTRLNNGNVNGLSAVLRRKMQSALYPQIGHFFCNIQERKSILSPDGDKDRDPLLINLLDEGQEIINNLKKLNLTPQSCYRDTEPINLYHKVGHGTLDMYVLSPARDSKEVRDFIQRWNTNDQKLFANQRSTKDFQFPLQNLVSICALLIWQPANPNDNITRILYPGSTPQQKIFEGVEKLRNLDYVKYPVCSESKLVTSSSIIALKSKQLKDASLEKLIQSESKKIEKLKEKPPKSGEIKSRVENKLVDADMTNGVPSENDTDKTVKKSDSTDSDKSVKSAKQKKVDDSKSELKQKDARTKSKIDSKHDKKKLSEKKASPTTPKKILDAKVNGESKDKPISKPIKYSPSTTPAKSAKEATNRKVIESKNKITAKKEAKTPTEKKEPKPERKPISRRAKAPATKTVSSPVKKVNGVQRPDILKKAKLDKEGTTDSSTVSTPSADQKDLTKLTPEELEQLKAQELADLKEEQEVVKEIEAVFRKGEVDKQSDSELRKVKDISLEDKSEPEEYLIIEKEEIEHDSLDDKDTKEDETQKHARDSEESEKMRKLSDDIKISMKEKEELLKQEPEEIVEGKDKEDKEKPTETSKEVSVTSPEDKIDTSIEKKTAEGEQNVALESQPDERYSATVESGATTAPTLPEDERITLDEIKEDNGDQVIEEKHVKEDTKEKDVPVIQLPAKPFEAVPKLPPVIGIRLDKQSHIRDIVKTPDEVADLPVHEEADIDQYHMDVMKTSMKTDDMKLQDRTDVEKEKDNDIAKGIISKESGADAKEDAVTPQKPVEVAPKAEEVKQITLEDRVESKTTEQDEPKDATPLKKPETVEMKSEVETKDVKEEDIADTTKPQPDELEIKTEVPAPTQKQSKDDILKTVESKPEISSKTIDVSKQVEIKKSEEPEEVAVEAVDEKILDVKDKEIEMVNELVEDADKDGKSTVETADKLEEVKKPPAESAVEKIEDKKPLKIEDERAVELPDVKDKDEKHVLKEVEEKVAAVKSEDQIKKSDADVEEVVVEDTPKTLPETTTKDIEFEAESLDHKKIEEAEKELKDLPITDKIEKEIVDEGKKVEKAEDIIVEDSKDVKDKDGIKIEDSHVTKEEAVKLEEKIEPETKEKDSAAVKEEPVKMEEKVKDDVADAAVTKEDLSKIEEKIKAEEKPKDDIKDIAVAKEEALKVEEKIKGEEKPKDDIKDAAVKMEESSKIEKEIKAEEKPKDDIKDIAVAKEDALKVEEKIKAEEKPKDDIKDAAVKIEESSKIEEEIRVEEKRKDAEVAKEEAPKNEEKLKAEEKPKDDMKEVAVAKEEVLKIEEEIKTEERPTDAAVIVAELSKIEEKIKALKEPKDDIRDAAVTMEESLKTEEKVKVEEKPKDDTKDDVVTKGEPSQIEETIKAEEKPKDDTKDASISKKEPSKIEETIKAEEKPKDDRKDDAVTKEEPSQIEEAIKAEEEPKDDVKDASISKKEPSKIEETIKTDEEPKGDTKDGAVIKEEPSKIEEKIIAEEKPKDDMKDAAVTKEQPSKIEEKTKTEEKPIDIVKDFAITKEEPIRVEEVIKTEAKPEEKLKGPEVTKEETTVLEEKIKVGEKPIDDVKDSAVTKDESVEGQGEVKKPKEESEDGVKDSVVTKKEPVKLEEKIEEKPKDSITTEEKALEEKVKVEEEQPETRKDSTATKEETVKLEDKIKMEEKPKGVGEESIVAKEEASKQEEEIKAEQPKDVKVSTITKEEPLKVEEKIKAEETSKVDAKDSEVTKAEPSTTEEKPKDDVKGSIATKEEPLKLEEKLKAEEKLKVDVKDSQVAKEEPVKVEEKPEIEEKIKDDVLTITKEEPLKLEDKIEKPKDGVKDLTAKGGESLKLEEKIQEEQTSTHEVKDSIATKEETVKLEQVTKVEEKPKDDETVPAIPKEEEIKTEKELKDKLKEEIPQFIDTDAKEPKEATLEEKADEKKESISIGKSEEVTSSIEKPDLQKDAKQEPIEMPSLETELKEAGIKEEKIEKERVEAEIAAEKDVKDLKDKELQESKFAATKPQQGEEELELVEKKPEKVAIDSKDAPSKEADKVDLKEIERIEEKPLTDEELEGEESIHERDVTFYIGDQKLEKTKAEQKEEKKKEEQASKEEQKSKLEERDTDDKQRTQDELDAEELKPELDEKQGEKKADKEADTSPPSIDYKNGKLKAEEELETFAVEEIKKDKIDGHAMGSSQEAIFDSNKYANGVQEKPTSSEKEKVVIEDEKGTKEIAEQKMKKEDKFGSESTLFEDEVVVLNGESAKDSKMIKVETDKPYMPVKDAHEEMKLVDGKKTSMELSEDRDIRQDDVKSGSQTESPETSSEQALQTFKENEILDKVELGRKSPKEREQDVAKIVASVAEVLKSDAPLEEFEGKLPLNITPFVPFTTSYTTELRETHITTVESPIRDDAKDVTDVEATEKKESKRLELLRDSKELMEATSKIISDIKGAKDEEQSDNGDTGTVHRMLVTASSEDGGEEMEICAKGTITFSKSPDSSSGRSSPDPSTQKLKSEEFAASGTSTPDIKVVSEREKAEVEDTEKDISDRKDSGKSTPKSASRMSPVSDSGIIEADKQDLGKSTPEPKDSKAKLEVEDEKKSSDSGRSTPEMLPVKTVDTLEEPKCAKVMFDSGRSSPDSKSIDDEKLPHDESKLEKAEDKLDEELKEDKKLESKQEIIKESAITQIDSKSDSIESTDTTKIPKPSELKSVDDKDITKDAPHLAKEKVETLSEAPSTDEIPPSYQDVEHAKTSEVKSEDIVTKDVPLQTAVQKEIYTLKDEEDNIVKKEVEVVKASSLQERPEAGADEAKQADEKTEGKYVEKEERGTIKEKKLEEIEDKDGVKTLDISTTHELSSTIEKDSDSKIADKEVGHSADLTSEVKVSEQKLADESQQHKSDGSTQKIDDAIKMHPPLSKEMEKEGMDKKPEKVEIDQESKEAKIAKTIDHKKSASDLDETKIQPETESLPGKEALDISAPGQGISTSEEVQQKHPESKPDATESKELPIQATSIKATEPIKDPKVVEAEVDLKQTVSSKETEQKQQESKDSKIIAEDASVKKSIVEQEDSLVHADTKLDELSKDIAKDTEEEVTSKERIQKDDPDVKKTTLDSKSDIESSTIKEGIKEDISSALKTQDNIEKVTIEKPTVIMQSTLEQELKISKLDDKIEDIKGKDLQHKEEEKTDDVKEKLLDQQEPEAKVEKETSVKKSTAGGDEETHLEEKPGEVKSEKKEHKDVEVEKPRDDGAVKEKDSKPAGLIDQKASEVFESKKGAEMQVVSKEDEVKDKVGGEGADPKLIKEEISKQEKQISDIIGEASHVIDAEDAKVSKDQQIKDEVCGEKSAIKDKEISIGEKKDIPGGKKQIEEAEVVDVSKMESSLKTPIEKIRTDLGKEDAAETPGQIVESKLEQPSSESSAMLSKSEATTKAKVDGVQSVAQARTEQSLEKEFAKVEDSKSKIEVADKELDSSKSSVIVVDHTKAEDDKLSETTTKPVEDEMSIKTETSVVEKTVKELDIDKGIKDTVRVFIESEKAVKDGHVSSIASSSKESSKRDSISGKSTPDIADVERDKQWQENLTYEKHIPGASTPPTVPVSPIVKDISPEKKAELVSNVREQEVRSCTPASDDYEHGVSSTHSDISLSQMSRAPNVLEGDEARESDEEDILGSPTSVTSQIGHSPSSQYDFDDDKRVGKADQMSVSFYGTLPGDGEDSGFKSGRFLDESDLDFEKAMREHRQARGEDLTGEPSSYLYEITTAKYGTATTSKDQAEKKTDIMTSSFIGTELPGDKSSTDTSKEKDPIGSWGKPLGLPSPAPPDNKGTPKKEKKLPPNVTAKNKLNDDKKRSESPSKYDKKQRKTAGPIYVDLTYVPHHGNSNYSYVEFFKRIRARYYVFSGIEPSKEVYNALLEAKQTWEDKELEVTIIPTYDTDVLGYWVAENEELLTKYKIDLSPSASRCTINLQDHETSCSAYRLEF